MQRPSRKILIISTGGTFNKVYNPLNASLEIDSSAKAIREIFSQWLCEFELVTIIDKDSLDINNDDREYLLKTIKNSLYNSIIVVHGSDTIDKSASFLASQHLDKKISLYCFYGSFFYRSNRSHSKSSFGYRVYTSS